jgi:DNA-binding transcriptional MerR regulator
MRIGELAQVCDCPVETIRYYEKIGLLPPPAREANGYRCYKHEHQQWLTFILRSRELGFGQDEVRQLTDLALQEKPACSAVHSLLKVQIKGVQKKRRELKQMQRALVRLKTQCEDGQLHDCPVIDELMR